MKEFIVHCPNGIRLQWFGEDTLSVRREAEDAGHRVVLVRSVVRTVPSEQDGGTHPIPCQYCRTGHGSECRCV